MSGVDHTVDLEQFLKAVHTLVPLVKELVELPQPATQNARTMRLEFCTEGFQISFLTNGHQVPNPADDAADQVLLTFPHGGSPDDSCINLYIV